MIIGRDAVIQLVFEGYQIVPTPTSEAIYNQAMEDAATHLEGHSDTMWEEAEALADQKRLELASSKEAEFASIAYDWGEAAKAVRALKR